MTATVAISSGAVIVVGVDVVHRDNMAIEISVLRSIRRRRRREIERGRRGRVWVCD